MYMTKFLLVVLGLFAVVGGCTSSNAGGLRPSKEEFTSDCLEVTMGGMTVDPDVGLALTLGLKNTTQEAAWVRVRFESPPPNTPGEAVRKLDPGASEMFIHSQSSVVPETNYPIFVETYRDAALTQPVEKTQTQFWFSHKDATIFHELAKKLQSDPPR